MNKEINIGENWEKYFSMYLNQIGDISAEKTKGSGGTKHEPDIVSNFISVSCKATNNKTFTLSKELIDELYEISSDRDGLKIIAVKTSSSGHKDNQAYVVMTTDQFSIMYKVWMDYIKENNDK